MRTEGIVVSAEGTEAVVETKRASACEGCHKKTEEGGCTVCTLMGGADRTLTTRAVNRIGAKVGDTVAVESETGRVLLYAALVFLVPLLTCLLGGLAAALLTEETSWRLLGAAVGFLLWFPILRIYSKRMQKKSPDAVIVEILLSGEAGKPLA